MKTASFSIAILNFFSRHGQYFHPTKDQPRTRPSSTFLYICYNFRQIFCTNVIQFFSVENMGNNQLKKCSKYHLVSLLNEKQRSTFANFWHLFIHVTLLTHSAMVVPFIAPTTSNCWEDQISSTFKSCWSNPPAVKIAASYTIHCILYLLIQLSSGPEKLVINQSSLAKT